MVDETEREDEHNPTNMLSVGPVTPKPSLSDLDGDNSDDERRTTIQ